MPRRPSLPDPDAEKKLRALTPKQGRFVAAYMANGGDVPRSAIEAGVNPGTPMFRKEAFTLFYNKTIRSHIMALTEKALKERLITANHVLAETSSLAMASLSDFIEEWDDDGAPTFKDFNEIPREKLIALKKLTVVTRTQTQKKSGETYTTKTVTVELHDKLRALEMIGKNLQLFIDRVALQNPDGTPVGPLIQKTLVLIPDNGRGLPIGSVEVVPDIPAKIEAPASKAKKTPKRVNSK